MPKIEEYGPSRVTTSVAREAIADPNKLQVNNSLNGVVALAEGAIEFKKRADIAEAEEAVSSFEKEKNDMFFNPDSGYFNTAGRTAYDGAGDVGKKLDDLRKKYSTAIKSQGGRDAFDRVSKNHLARANEDIMKHASKNLKAWESANTRAAIENSLENASLYHADEDQLNVQRSLGRESVLDSAEAEGLDGDALKERLQNFESSFARSAITAATAQGSADGQKLFDKYKERLEGPDVLSITKLIDSKKKSEEVRDNASMAVLKAGSLINSYGDSANAREAILKDVNEIKDPELRKEVMRESMYQLRLKRVADSEESAAIYELAEDHIIKGGSVQSFKSQNADAWEKMTAAQKRKIAEGSTIGTDYIKLSELLLLPKQQLAEVNPTDHYDSLSKADRQRLITAVKSARNGSVDSQVGRTRLSETNAIVSQIFGEKKNWNNKKREQVNAFHGVIDDEVNLREKQKGSPLSSQEYTDLLSSMTRKVVKETMWFLPNSKLDLSDVSAEESRMISRYLQDNNVPVTSDNIIKALNDPEHKQAAGIE
jgi:uncharacterized protein YqeY